MRLSKKTNYEFMTTTYDFMTTWAILEKEEHELQQLIQANTNNSTEYYRREIAYKSNFVIKNLQQKLENPNHINNEIQRCKTAIAIASCSEVSKGSDFYKFSQHAIKLYNELIEEYEGYLGPPIMK